MSDEKRIELFGGPETAMELFGTPTEADDLVVEVYLDGRWYSIGESMPWPLF